MLGLGFRGGEQTSEASLRAPKPVLAGNGAEGGETESTGGGMGIPHRPVSTLYVSSGLRFKLRSNLRPLRDWLGAFYCRWLLTADRSSEGLLAPWPTRSPCF